MYKPFITNRTLYNLFDVVMLIKNSIVVYLTTYCMIIDMNMSIWKQFFSGAYLHNSSIEIYLKTNLYLVSNEYQTIDVRVE